MSTAGAPRETRAPAAHGPQWCNSLVRLHAQGGGQRNTERHGVDPATPKPPTKLSGDVF